MNIGQVVVHSRTFKTFHISESVIATFKTRSIFLPNQKWWSSKQKNMFL